MNKEELELRHNLLETDVRVKSGDLEYANTALAKVKAELANINKPKITEDLANELVSCLCRAFNEALGDVDSSDFDIEFSLDYNNTVVVDNINGLDDVDAPEDAFHSILSDVFAITLDEDEDVYNKP
jgi:hypothetical protein|tara:strand:+ start:157 stop:537 length:381 start_codon:yes stop_codon:yes gene_type:complete